MERNAIFDFMKSIAILSVVVGHCEIFLPPPIVVTRETDTLYRFIYSYHMPLFMIISGFFSYSAFAREFSTLLKDKVRRILIPCLFWQIIMLAWRPYSIQEAISEFWFLKCLFVLSVITFFVHYFTKNINRTLCLVFIILALLPTSRWNLFSMYPFYAIGILLRHNKVLDNIIYRSWKWQSLFFFLFVILFVFWRGDMTIEFNQLNLFNSIGHYWLDVFCYIYRLLIGCTAFFVIYIICTSSLSHIPIKVKNLFQLIGRNTLGIYVMHGIFIILISRFIEVPNPMRPFYSIILGIIITIICSILCLIISRNKIFGRVALGEK